MTSKSLYTAVLYDKESTKSPEEGCRVAPSTYLKHLTREHIARASMEELDPSQSHSPVKPDSESQRRIITLQAMVRKAYSDAGGNPADGRWSLVYDLLRLNTARGVSHWIGTHTDGSAPGIKHKIERWRDTTDFQPLAPEVTIEQVDPAAEYSQQSSAPRYRVQPSQRSTVQPKLKAIANAVDPLSNNSKPGFSVVKRANTLPLLTELLVSNKRSKHAMTSNAQLPETTPKLLRSPIKTADQNSNAVHNYDHHGLELSTDPKSLPHLTSDVSQMPSTDGQRHTMYGGDEEPPLGVIVSTNIRSGLNSKHSNIPKATVEADHQLSKSKPEMLPAPNKPFTSSPVPRTDLSHPHTTDRTTTLKSVDSTSTYKFYGLDTLDALDSVKSLSSLAGSDSESNDEGDLDTTMKQKSGIDFTFDSPFRPRFTSTQIQDQKMVFQSNGPDLPVCLDPLVNANIGTPLLDDLKGAADNLTSQLRAEVDSQVDEFDKFMEADLGYGYEVE